MSNIRKNIKKTAYNRVVRGPKRFRDLAEKYVPRIRKQTRDITGKLKKRSEQGRKTLKKGIKKAIKGRKRR